MDNQKPHIYPEEKESIFSRLFFLRSLKVLFRGYRKKLSEEELQRTRKVHQSKLLGDKLEKVWLEEVSNAGKDASLWKALIKVFGFEFALNGVLVILIEFLRLIQPILVWKILSHYISASVTTTKKYIYLYTGLMMLAAILNLFGMHHCWYQMEHIGIKLKAALSTLVYRKCLKLDQQALQDITSGHIFNLVATDVAKFNTGFIRYVHYLWAFPIILVILFVSLYIICDSAALIGMFIILAYLPLQIFLSKRISSYRLKMTLKTDQRVKLLAEIIKGIKIVKMLTWEKPFKRLVETYRKAELHELKSSLYTNAVSTSFFLCLNKVAVYLCILAYVLMGHTIQSTYIFVVTMFYDVVKLTGTLFFAWSAIFRGEVIISVKRIEHFLKTAETTKQKTPVDKGITLNGAFVGKNILSDISLTINSNQKIAIVGPVGCGKSTILKVMLKEIPLCRGTIEIGGTISYASQEPWIFEGTIKDNIVFGELFDATKYKKVIEVCALERDLSILPYGDSTFVGSQGAVLSGGQKSRINLARAVYKDCHYYLLDDPFASVDAEVGDFILKNCLNDFLKSKGVLLITHQLEYLNEFNCIYLMKSGKFVKSGSYKSLQSSDYFQQIKTMTRKDRYKQNDNKRLLDEDIFHHEEVIYEQQEEVTMGSLSHEVYKNYFSAAGSFWMTTITLFLYVLFQFVTTSTDYFLSLWVNLQQSQNSVPDYFLHIYTSLTITLIPFSFLSNLVLVKMCVTASKTLHNEMLHNIVSAPISFFNSNPCGRIINRFSSDIGQIDRLIPLVLNNVIIVITSALGIFTLIITVNFWMLIPTIIALIILFIYRKVYLGTSRFVKRVEGKSRSPVLSHLNSTLQGLATIRVSDASQQQKNIFEKYQDMHTAAGYMFLACESAFGFFLDLGSFTYFVIVVINIVCINSESRSGSIGLTIASTIVIMGMLQYGLKQYAELENQMVSVERVLEYTRIVPEPKQKKLHKPAITCGKIHFRNVFLRYGIHQKYSLRELTFVINPSEKVGVVGRTGSGKSSLISVLFGLFKFEGEVFIDGTNIQEIPLKTLRSSISIIPQDPVLFSCSLRTNLDPYSQYSDTDLWNVLEEVKMKATVAALPSGLSSKLTEGGLNFSVGQRQLLCLARAVLKMNKILILDEATANIDLHTEELIREAINRKFKDSTVLTITHRLHSIMNYDQVLVMEQGSILEFGSPHQLLQDTKGGFYRLVRAEENAE